MDWINANAGWLSVAILFLVAWLAYPGKKFSLPSIGYNPPRRTKTRAEHEAELQRMMNDLDSSPPTQAELTQWAAENRDTYIRNMAAFATEEAWWDQANTYHWEEYLILDGKEKVVTHNSDGTGYLDK